MRDVHCWSLHGFQVSSNLTSEGIHKASAAYALVRHFPCSLEWSLILGSLFLIESFLKSKLIKPFPDCNWYQALSSTREFGFISYNLAQVFGYLNSIFDYRLRFKLWTFDFNLRSSCFGIFCVLFNRSLLAGFCNSKSTIFDLLMNNYPFNLNKVLFWHTFS